MGMMGVFKWLRKDIVQRDRNRRSLTPKITGLNNEAYRNAIQAFIDRRRSPSDPGCIISPNSPDKERLELFIKKNYEKKRNDKRECEGIPGVPHVQAPEIFEIGWVAGTEDRLMELIFAEWQNTRVSLRRHTHPECRNAVRADLEVLTEIRHPNVLLLMATTHTDDHGLVAIFESIDCTLYNYVHEQGERVSVQGIAKCAGSLAGALKHAHMRGYVHGAISSHCVFLATCGTVKLGGWELAAAINTPKIVKEYEERLRYEIYRWLAPEIFAGKDPSKATDIYGLTLLMWEMCTMNVPWNGLSKSEVERQYIQCERGVATDIYDFPPLLNNLLEAGLKLNVSQRTLDMSRMRRFLQTLEIQYEDAEPLYVEPSSNNNNPQKPISTPPASVSPTIHRCTSAQTPKRYSERKSINAEIESCNPRLLNLNVVEEPKLLKSHDCREFDRTDTAAAQMFKHIVKGSCVEKTNSRNVNKTRSNEKLSGQKVKPIKSSEAQKKSSSKENFSLAANTAPSVESTDDESFNDTRTNIKKLKQSLASKRENFFYGSDSSQNSPPGKNEITKNRILTQVRSKAYEPHKPASHKTSLEPKMAKSPGQYNATVSKSRQQVQTSPYSSLPIAVRDAAIQPKVLNSDSQSFFESSLWKKEKMICISKMRRSNDLTYLVSHFPTVADQSTNDKAESTGSNHTYTVEEPIRVEAKEIAANNSTFQPIELGDVSSSTVSRSKSLQALQDALERATDIVRSTTPQTQSSASSPFKSPQSIEINPNVSAANESLFEHIYDVKHGEPDDEIKSIERSTNGEDTFLLPQTSDNEEDNRQQKKSDFVIRRRSAVRDEAKRASFETSRLSSVICESIAETSNENDHSSTDSKPDDRTVIICRSPVDLPENTDECISSVDLSNNISEVQQCQGATENNKEPDPETSFALMVFNDKSGCHCNPKSALARRRSLPAALGQLRNLSNVSLGKLPIRKVVLPDNTVEDLYIDDEFGDSLNVNMVLLDGDTSLDDEDFLPDLLELSDLRGYE